MRARNVAGPTFSERIRRRQARRWLSSRRAVGSGGGLGLGLSSGPGTDFALSPGDQPLNVGMMLDDEQHAQHPDERGWLALAEEPKHERRDDAGHKGGERGVAAQHRDGEP